jgi:2'-5' RNA ligase
VTVRTFVALPIPSAWTEYLAGLSRTLAPGTRGVSWVRAENLHVTVRFLGDLDESGVARVRDAVRRAAGPLAAPWVRLGALGAFPSLARPRVLWVGLAEGEPEVLEVARAVDETLARAGFGPPDKPFRAHLTLARIREGARGPDALRDVRLDAAPAGEFLERLTVMKSDLHPSGARYTPLEEVRLRPPGR